MKKVLILILAVILSLSVFAMAACQQPCETHVDGNHDGICDVCEATGLSVTHTDSNHDGKCDGCGGAAQFQHVDAAHDGQCDVCKKPVEITHVDANNDGTCDVCQVLVDHNHADANNDGICDIPACDYEFPWVADLASAKEYVNSMYLMGAEVTAADFKVITNVPVGTSNFTITWEIQSEVEGQTAVVLGEIDQTTKQQLVDVDTASAAEVAYKLVGTISDEAGHTTTVEYSRLVPIGFKMSQVHPYVGSIYQGTLGKTLYLDGGVSGRYLTMTENASKAVSVYAEEVKGGYKLYILDGETKKYITIYANGEGKTSVNYDANGETVYAYNPSINAFFTTFNNGEVYLGTYSNYNTVSVSATSYITPENTGVSQFPLEMLPIADGATYAAFITQAQQDKVVYVTGEVSGRYLATSENEAQAVVIYAEKVAGGYKFYKLNGETKEYITIYANDEGKDSVKFDANGETVFAYDPVVNAWVANFNDKDKYLGTYSSYTTVSVSNLSYITAENTGKSQFPLEFKAVVAGAPAHECANVCSVCGKCTNENCAESVCANKCEGHKPVAGPVVGQAYIMSVNQGNLGKTLYFNGQTREADGYPWYFKTSENKDDAVSVFVEETTGGFYLYFMNGETKTYIRLYERSAGSASLALVTEAPAEVYTWDETYATLKLTVGENSYYIGTYSTFNTLSGSSYSKIVGSFPCAYTPVEGSVVPPVEEHKCANVCETCGKCTNEDCAESVCAEKCEGHTPAVVLEDVVINISNLAESAEVAPESELVAGSGVYLTKAAEGKKFVIDGNEKSIDGFDFTLRFKFYGTMKNESAGITGGLRLELKGAAKITVYAISGNKTATDRNLVLKDSTFADVQSVNVLGDKAYKVEFEVSAAGTYYLGSSNSGMNIYYLAIAYQAPAEEPAVVINGTNYSEAQAEEALLALKADDVVTILANATIAKEYTFVAANYTIGEGAVLTAQANMVAPAGAKLTVSANAKLVVEAGVTIDISALTQEAFATSADARLVIAAGAKVIMPAYTEQLWKDAYLKAVIEAMISESEVGAELVLGETKLTKTANGWEAESGSGIADALAGKEGDAAKFEGTVSEIYQAWDSYYKNMSFYVTDGTNRILVFRAGTQVGVGDYVSVDGKVTIYNEKPQIAQGATVVIKAVHECNEFTPADCLNAAVCTVCGKVNGEPLGHTDEADGNGKCDRCDASVGGNAGQQFTATKTMKELITALKWTNTTTKQSFTLDDNVSVKINGGSNTGKAYNGDHIRVYATDTPAGTITISVPAGYELVSVKISTQTGTYAYLQIDGNSTKDLSNKVVEVSGQSVVFKSVKNGSDGKQVRVTAIEVVYVEVAE